MKSRKNSITATESNGQKMLSFKQIRATRTLAGQFQKICSSSFSDTNLLMLCIRKDLNNLCGAAFQGMFHQYRWRVFYLINYITLIPLHDDT